MKKWMHSAWIAVASFMATAATAQVPSSLDTTFRTSIISQAVNDIHILDDGKLFLSGQIRFPGDPLSFRGSARLLPNGQQDQAYNNYFGGGKIVPWVDGQFYVSNGLVRRMQPDGLIDPSFIMMNNGIYFQSFVNGDYHVYPDGRVLMSGKHTLSDTARGFVGNYNLMWFSNTGYLDTTSTHRKGNNCTVFNFAELPNGQFICTSTCTQFEGQAVDWIFKVHADGTPDTTFRSGVFIGRARTFHGLQDGRVYVGGNFQRSEVPNDTLRLVRFMPDGSLDPTFSVQQFLAGEGLNTAFGATVHGITPWRNGQLIITGEFKRVNGQVRRGICLVDSTGALLDAFSDAGIGPFTYQGSTRAALIRPAINTDTTLMYICGVYVGYNDGLTNDPQQRFVSRLHLGDISTAVQEAAPAEEGYLHLYPNPASDQVFLRTPNTVHGPAQVQLSDALGRFVWQRNVVLSEGDIYLPVDGLRAGLYLVELHSGGRMWRARLVRE